MQEAFLNSQKFRILRSEHFQTAFLQRQAFLPQCPSPKHNNLKTRNEFPPVFIVFFCNQVKLVLNVHGRAPCSVIFLQYTEFFFATAKR